MKKTLMGVIAFSLAMVQIGCMLGAPGAAGNGPQDPLFPRTSSIMPLTKGNIWTYSFTAYDSLGNMKSPHRLDWSMKIEEQYGVFDDSILTLLDYNNRSKNFPDYAYQYETDNNPGTGYLLVHRGIYPLSERGLYVIGTYHDTITQLYPKEQLWLAYPADSGKRWQYKPDPVGDSTTLLIMEVVSNNIRFIIPNSENPTGIAVFDSCYLYKQSTASGDSISYYYYNEKIGCLGYRRYINNTLRVTYYLKSFDQSHYYDYY